MSITEVVSEEISDVKPTLNNSAIKFFKEEKPTLKGEPLREQPRAFCCKAPLEPLEPRMFAVCLFHALSNC